MALYSQISPFANLDNALERIRNSDNGVARKWMGVNGMRTSLQTKEKD